MMLARQFAGLARSARTSNVVARPVALAAQRCFGIGVKPAVVKEPKAPPTPRTTTHPDHVKMKKPTKYAAHMMSQLDMEFRQKVDRSKDDDFEIGDAVMVKAYDFMTQQRPAIYKGVVIAIKNKGLSTTFRILNTYDGEKFEVCCLVHVAMSGLFSVAGQAFH